MGSNPTGDIEYIEYVEGGGQGNSNTGLSEELENIGISQGDTATVGVIPVEATTYNGGSARWVSNF